MPSFSWNEIQNRGVVFAGSRAGETYKKENIQNFWRELLTLFEINHRRHGVFFEYAIKKGGGKHTAKEYR